MYVLYQSDDLDVSANDNRYPCVPASQFFSIGEDEPSYKDNVRHEHQYDNPRPPPSIAIANLFWANKNVTYK